MDFVFEAILFLLLIYTLYIYAFKVYKKIKIPTIEGMGAGTTGAGTTTGNKPSFFPCMKTYKTMADCAKDSRCHWKYNKCMRKHKLCDCKKSGGSGSGATKSSSTSTGAR